MVIDRTASVMGVRGLASWLVVAGIPPESVLGRAGIDVSKLHDPEHRLSHKQIVDLWREAPAALGDSNFGLHAAEFIHSSALSLGRLDVLDYLARASATLGEALGRFDRYQRMLHEELIEIALVLGEREPRLVVRLLDVPGGSLRHAAECALALLWLRTRTLTGGTFAPAAVHFQHARPDDLQEYRRIFDTALLEFASESDAIVLPPDALALPLATADPKLCALLDRQAEELVAGFGPQTALGARVRKQIHRSLCGGDASIELVAAALGVGVRTLQRQLREEGLLYKQLLEEVRCELAANYLRDEERTLAEVAFLLGFSEVSAFHRAFRRWTGKTPAAFRAAV